MGHQVDELDNLEFLNPPKPSWKTGAIPSPLTKNSLTHLMAVPGFSLKEVPPKTVLILFKIFLSHSSLLQANNEQKELSALLQEERAHPLKIWSTWLTGAIRTKETCMGTDLECMEGRGRVKPTGKLELQGFIDMGNSHITQDLIFYLRQTACKQEEG